MIPKSFQKLIQNRLKINTDFWMRFGSENGSKMDPKRTPIKTCISLLRPLKHEKTRYFRTSKPKILEKTRYFFTLILQAQEKLLCAEISCANSLNCWKHVLLLYNTFKTHQLNSIAIGIQACWHQVHANILPTTDPRTRTEHNVNQWVARYPFVRLLRKHKWHKLLLNSSFTQRQGMLHWMEHAAGYPFKTSNILLAAFSRIGCSFISRTKRA